MMDNQIHLNTLKHFSGHHTFSCVTALMYRPAEQVGHSSLDIYVLDAWLLLCSGSGWLPDSS